MNAVNRPGHPLPYERYIEAIEHETARFAAVVAGADPATPVPACPGWTLAELIRHTGAVQRRFRALVSRLVQEPPRSREIDLGLPEREEDLADWLSSGVTEATAVLRGTDPQAPMWAWGADQHARFWARRMLFETLVHRVDAEAALGVASDVDAALAADGVDEFLVNLAHAGFFAPEVAKLRGNGETIAFRSTGPGQDGAWVVRLDPDGFGVRPQAGQDADAAPGRADAGVQGRAADLLLLLYGRLSYGDPVFDVTGDPGLLDRWAAHSRF